MAAGANAISLQLILPATKNDCMQSIVCFKPLCHCVSLIITYNLNVEYSTHVPLSLLTNKQINTLPPSGKPNYIHLDFVTAFQLDF